MSKRTPGPWQYAKLDFGGFAVADKDGLKVASIHSAQGDKQEANARLIAVAPEAVSELERVTALLDIWATDHPQDRTAEVDAAIHCARSVISKAK